MSKPKRALTIDDVAALAGVSYQTVSRVLNGMRDVAPGTREKVQTIIRELDYRPNRTARQLASRRSSTIGVILADLECRSLSQILVNCESASKELGLSCMVHGIAEPSAQEVRRAAKELRSHEVCGILLNLPHRLDLQEAREVCHDIPIVAIDSHLGFDCPGVYINQVLGSRLATQHLVQAGHRDIAYLRGPQSWGCADLRVDGWQQELEASGLQPGPVDAGDWTAGSGYEAARRLLDRHWGKFTALIAGNDQMALGAALACEEKGLEIPKSLSLVGFDDIPEAKYFRPPLTTVRQDLATVARLGVRTLLDLMDNRKTVHSQMVDPPFVERMSTAAPAKKNRPRIRKANLPQREKT